VRARCFLLALLWLTTVALRAYDSLASARHAQALLGPELWSRVIRVENETVFNPYPRSFHALVFELAGVLWFYTPTDGTQSLSTHRGGVEADKADLGPLLRAIDPGFHRWREVAGVDFSAPPPPGRPGNACFVESVAALRTRLAAGGLALRPQLLAYYVDLSTGLLGHTVLMFDCGGRIEVIDPELPGVARFFPEIRWRDSLALARELGGERVTHARLLPFEPPAAPRSSTCRRC
jgi:hypothetical protein